MHRVSTSASIRVDPRFGGERDEPKARGAIIGIADRSAFDVGRIWYATLRALLENIKSMMPSHIFRTRKSLYCLGGAFAKSSLLRDCAQDVFSPLKVRFVRSAEYFAAAGAAMTSSMRCGKTLTRDAVGTTSSSENLAIGLVESLQDDDSMLSAKVRFEKKSVKVLEVYRKMYHKNHKSAPKGVEVAPLYGVRRSYLSCQVPALKETIFPFAGVKSPSMSFMWDKPEFHEELSDVEALRSGLDSASKRAETIESLLLKSPDPQTMLKTILDEKSVQ